MVWGLVAYWWVSMVIWFKPIKTVMVEHKRGPLTSISWLLISPAILPLTFLAGTLGLLACFLFGGREFTREFMRRFRVNYEKAKQEALSESNSTDA